jgi:hypothetical protein
MAMGNPGIPILVHQLSPPLDASRAAHKSLELGQLPNVRSSPLFAQELAQIVGAGVGMIGRIPLETNSSPQILCCTRSMQVCDAC